MALLSVIIPTHNRAHILEQCLKHLEKQTVAQDLEVIVVSDGHDKNTAELFAIKSVKTKSPRTKKEKWNLKIIFLEIPKCHQGVARNKGVSMATAGHVLFIGDDIFLAPDACEKHIALHHDFESKSLSLTQVVLGYTTWDPSLRLTSVMKWLEESGWQFGYPQIARYAHARLPSSIQHLFTYTSHVSAQIEVARHFPFREDVSLYGWEDIEWGMRLKDAGIRIFYEPDAKAFHHHAYTLAESIKRMEILGESAMHMQTIVPSFDRVPQGIKRVGYEMTSLLPTLSGQHRRGFMRGMKRAENDLETAVKE